MSVTTEQLSSVLSDAEMAALEEAGLSDEELASMSLEGEAPDDDDDEAPADEAADDDGADDDDNTSDDGDSAGAADDAGDDDAAPDPEPEPKQFRPSYKADLPEGFEAKRKEVEDARAALETKYRDGDLSFDEFRAEERKLQVREAEMDRAALKAEMAREMNEQSAKQEWEWTIKRFFRDTKRAEGVDYEDAKLNKSLDVFIRALAADTENADRDADWFLAEAHKMVRIKHGLSAPEQKAGDKAATVREAADARKPKREAIPKTLADVAGGDGPGDIAGEFAHLDKLTGIAFERAFARMSEDQRARYLNG